MTFSVFLDKQADIVLTLLQVYFPKGCKVIDLTYGHGGLWRRVKESEIFKPLYHVTACDAAPSEKVKDLDSVIKRDLTTDDYSDLGLHQAAFFDPPYLIGKSAFEYPLTRKSTQPVPMALQGRRSWANEGLDKFTGNLSIQTFNERVNGLKKRIRQVLAPGGILFVKVMDPRNEGKIVPHHVSIINALTNGGGFDLIDLAIYVRQGATTWKTNGLQCLHGYWLVFKMRSQAGLD